MTTSMNAPFLDVSRFDVEESETSPAPPASAPWTPFLSVYEFNGSEQEFEDPMREAYASLVNELYDEEFDESLFELLSEARSLHDAHIANDHSTADADRIVTQHFAELTRESEAMLDAMAREFSRREDTLLDREMAEFVEHYAPATALQPSFEDFLGRLAKKLVKGVSKVAKTIKNVALGPIFAQIKRILNPLLKQVMLRAIDRLPVSVRPAAHQLAQRLGFAKAPTATATAPVQPDAAAAAPGPSEPSATPTEPVAGATATAQDVDTSAPSVEGGGSPVQADAGATFRRCSSSSTNVSPRRSWRKTSPSSSWSSNVRQLDSASTRVRCSADLDQARERFTEELENLKEGENPAPYIENFLPAVLPALRTSRYSLIGRHKVVNFLAGLLGKLISKLVGPAQTPALSRAIVDAGLKLISLELAEEDEARLATSAIAATVEETLSRVASLPIMCSTTRSCSKDSPSKRSSSRRPPTFLRVLGGDLSERGPISGGRRQRGLGHAAAAPAAIQALLAHVQREDHAAHGGSHRELRGHAAFRLPAGSARRAAKARTSKRRSTCSRCSPGGTAADIARSESETLGSVIGDEVTLSQLQPLTHEAAGALLGAPRSEGGCRRERTSGPSWPGSALSPARGQTAVDGARSSRAPASAPAGACLRHARLPQDLVRVCVFLSEVKAQRLAVRLRQQSHAGSLTVAFTKLLSRRLPADSARQAPAAAEDRAHRGAARIGVRQLSCSNCRRSSHQAFVAKCRNGWCRHLPSSSRRSRRSSSPPRRIPPTA